MSDPLRLVAFDLDGTLIDSADSIVTGVLACWDACGFPAPEKENIRRIIGLPWEASICELLPGAGKTEFDQIKAYHLDVASGKRPRPPRKERLFPGIKNVLNQVEEAGYLLSIITSRSSGRLQELLEANGIGRRFATLKTTDDGPGKPNPFLMDQTLLELGVDKENAVMIGDTTFDMIMARSAGTAAIGVTWGVHESDELIGAGAGHVVDDLPCLYDAINLAVEL
jgi:phosphoglycolate phosphatase